MLVRMLPMLMKWFSGLCRRQVYDTRDDEGDPSQRSIHVAKCIKETYGPIGGVTVAGLWDEARENRKHRCCGGEGQVCGMS